ncbi:hypothetical protein A4G26_09540 [Mycobacterium kansasii]|nr:hypothetical protein A4G26_09540 [Mycobacterium kansasii]
MKTSGTTTGAGAWASRRNIQIVFTDRARCYSIVQVKAVCTCPLSSIDADTFGIEYFLRGCDDLVDGCTGCVRRVSIAASLDYLYLR